MVKKLVSKQVLILLVFCFFTTVLYSQNNTKSSDSKINDEIEACYLKAKNFQLTNLDSAIKYAQLGFSLIDEFHGQKQKNNYLLIIGFCYQKLNKYKLALKYLQQAYERFEIDKNKQKLLSTSSIIATVYAQSCYYDKALLYYQKSLLLSTELKDTIQQCNALINSATIYYLMKEYKLALTIYEKALILATRFQSELTIAHIIRNIAITYSDMNDDKKALEYQKQSLEIYKKLNNKYYIAVVTADIGSAYMKLKKNNLALSYFEKAYLLVSDLHQEYLESHILFNIGDIYLLNKNYNKAKENLEKAEKIAINTDNKVTLSNIYESFYNYYSELKDYKQALDYYKRYKVVNDSIFSNESSDKIAELQVKFDIQEKENENQILLQKNEIQQLDIHKQIYLRNTFIYISIIISLMVIIIIIRFWIKHRANKMLMAKNELINIQKNELEVVYKTKDRLFSIITHDLKNPFSTIVTLVNFMKTNYFTMEENQKYSGILSLEKSISNANSLLEDLLDWLNAEGNNLIIDKTTFDIDKTVKSVMELYSARAEQKSVILQSYLNPKTFVNGDERMIKTVIRNLIDNSLKFTFNNGKIDIYAKEEDGKIIISIKDTGIGIDIEDKDKLFKMDSLFTSKGTEYEKGSGLGLILSKEFIEKNDGKIWFESETDIGSTFYFSINKAVYNE